MRKSQEANDSVTIDQEQADQVRRTTGATLAARALEEVLPAIGKGYAPQTHARVAERMVRDMDKPKHTPGPYPSGYTPNKADDRLAKILNAPEAMAAVEVLRRSGLKPGTVSDYMNMLDLHALPDDVRVIDVSAHGRIIAEGECGICWYLRHGYVWCVKSTTQCDFCGPVATWKKPEHARAALSAARGEGRGG